MLTIKWLINFSTSLSLSRNLLHLLSIKNATFPEIDSLVINCRVILSYDHLGHADDGLVSFSIRQNIDRTCTLNDMSCIRLLAFLLKRNARTCVLLTYVRIFTITWKCICLYARITVYPPIPSRVMY